MVDKKKKILILSCIFFLIFMYACNTMTDYDYWFHYSCGEWVWQNKSVPKTAIWSWYGIENNLEWISHEWLFGLFIFGFTNLFGLKALTFFCPFILATLGTFIFNYGYKTWEKNPILIPLFALPLALCFSAVAVPRPHLFMYWMFFGLLLILFKEEKEHSKTTWLLIPLTILWTNLHGGSYIIIFVMFGLLILCQAFNLQIGRICFEKVDKKITLNRILIFIISFASVIFNGHGVKMFIYPITNMADTVMISSISEWQGLELNSLSMFGVAAIILMLSYIVFVVATKKEIKPFKFLLSGMWILLGFKSIRFIPMMAIVLCLTTIEYFDIVKEKVISQFNTLLVIVLVALVGATGYRYVDFYNKPFNMDKFPSEEMIKKLQGLPEETHLYNEYNIGGYLTYKHINTFIDGRADIYSHFNMSDYVNTASLNDNVEEFVEKYDFDYMLITKERKLDYWINMESTIEKEIEFEDEHFILYRLIKDKD